jgi:NAD(P)-dependent dehydrogenase (short-subunit alcohol dehydrogenase family)
VTARLEGRTALITGAARGLGASIAEFFAQKGAHASAADSSLASGGGVAYQASKLGPTLEHARLKWHGRGDVPPPCQLLKMTRKRFLLPGRPTP